jgi:hypothetical protein
MRDWNYKEICRYSFDFNPFLYTILVVKGFNPFLYTILVVKGFNPFLYTILVVKGFDFVRDW